MGRVLAIRVLSIVAAALVLGAIAGTVPVALAYGPGAPSHAWVVLWSGLLAGSVLMVLLIRLRLTSRLRLASRSARHSNPEVPAYFGTRD